MKTIALYSNKGGVGKTTTAVNLAYLAAKSGYKTLICDLDPQSSATYFFRVKPKLKRKTRGLIKKGKWIDQSIKGTDFLGLDLLPADFSHRNLDITFYSLSRRKHRLEIVLKPLRKEYELIILDCPPTINILAENIFNASDYLIVPIVPTTLSLRAHELFLKFLIDHQYKTKKVRAFFSMVDRQNEMHQELIPFIREKFSGILKHTIPFFYTIEQMGIYREPVPVYAPDSPAASAYQKLWKEINHKLIADPQIPIL